MLVVVSLLFAVVGVKVGHCGLVGIWNRARWLEFARTYEDGKRQNWLKLFAITLISLEMVSGLSMLAAAILLSLNPKVALMLGLWPVAFGLTLAILPKRNRKRDRADPASN